MTYTKDLKCVCVGDCASGKTGMLASYKSGKFPTEYVPTVVDNYDVDIQLEEGTSVKLHIWDSAGLASYDRLRPLSYINTDVFIVCYSVRSPMSLENVTAKWLPEIRGRCPKTPFLLVGTHSDVRTDTSEQDQPRSTLVDPSRAEQVGSRTGATLVMECSAKTQMGLKDVFVEAAKVGLTGMQRKKHNGCVLL